MAAKTNLPSKLAIGKNAGGKFKLENFERQSVLGRGSFGEVLLVREKKSSNVFAMKIMKKKEMIKREQLNNIWNERRLLIAENHWFVQLHHSFQDSKFLYLVTEFCPGGDYMELLIKKKKLSEASARFYIAEIAIAINELHKLKFAHRDIKPDNILIDASGHIKLTDFGLCKQFAIPTPKAKKANEAFEHMSSKMSELVANRKI